VFTFGCSFSLHKIGAIMVTPWQQTTSETSLGLFWFGKGDGDKQNDGEGLGGVAQVMESMDGFKKSQQIGKLTSNLVQDLGSTVVEGSAAEGKVRVFMDGEQRPKRVQIDEEYGEAVDVDDLSSALLVALQECYAKSREKQEEKMKDLYSELGLPPSPTP
jgi:DNA-binding YbaB/EbfC family protein